MPTRYEELFATHRNARVPQLWPWQNEVLGAYSRCDGDAAVELPTGTGKTLVGLLVGEHFRQAEGKPVAYLAGNKQLAQQVERQARELNFPVVRFQGRKESWDAADVRRFNWGSAVGVMNYWNYFNENPGVEPAGMLILDDVHLLEGPLRDFFTVSVHRGEPLFHETVSRIVDRFPYYRLAADLLNGVVPPQPPEMLAFPDSAALAGEIRDLLDAHIVSRSEERWWAWQRIRTRLYACCWLVSGRGLTLTPYIPPTQEIRHFDESARRLYLSATIGTTDDLQRRLGVPPCTKLTATVQPRQGERFVVMRSETESLTESELVEVVQPLLVHYPKALWLCARSETADNIVLALEDAQVDGDVRRLIGDNGQDEPFAAASAGHLVTAGRYDGMDFPEDACRVEVLPEVPIATSDLEEFVTAYLRDAPFAEMRFAQRVAQALGRCNRTESDRAVYVLADPEFVSRFSQRRAISSLPDEVRSDVAGALDRADRGFPAAITEAIDFLAGEELQTFTERIPTATDSASTTATDEVEGLLALWREDYARAAQTFDRVATGLSAVREMKAFWLAFRALALIMAEGYGDLAAAREARAALRSAAATGASSTFFTRLRHSEARLAGSLYAGSAPAGHDEVFTAWDTIITRYGAVGPRFDGWSERLFGELQSNNHDLVAKALARVGGELLGLPSEAPQATSGEHDAHWDLRDPERTLAFEVKLAPQRESIVNGDVEQAEGAARAIETGRRRTARIVIVTPHGSVESTALGRLERGRLLQTAVLVEEVRYLVDLLREYRRGWSEDAEVRSQRRAAVERSLPAVDWLWRATERSSDWITALDLSACRGRRAGA